MRTVYYYQTIPVGEQATLLVTDPEMEHTTDVIIGAVHFGWTEGADGREPYVHLNDHPPSAFTGLLDNLRRVRNVRVHLMIGGAGCGLGPLLEEPSTFYPIFRDRLMDLVGCCHGINLDIEEFAREDDVERLVERLHADYPHLEITMAPVAGDLLSVGYARTCQFSHAKFVASDAARLVSAYLVQAYEPELFSAQTIRDILDGPCGAHLREDQIGIGMMSGQMGRDMGVVKERASTMRATFPGMWGIFDWEMFDAVKGWSAAASGCNTYRYPCVIL